jgi:nicotinamidase-related amidase
MKQLAVAVLAFMVFTGFRFATTGRTIATYDHPRTALLVLDMQEDFLGERAKMPINRDQIPVITGVVNSLVDEFQRTKQPIIYVKSEFPKHALGNRIRHFSAIEGTPGTSIFAGIRISGSAIFSKKAPDAFTSPAFEDYLIATHVNKLVITGVYADQCVLYTTLGALNRGYQVVFVRNGVGDSSDKAVNKACEDVRKRGGEIIDYQPGMHVE